MDNKHRDIVSKNIMGRDIMFIEENERIIDRVENISYEEEFIKTMVLCSEEDDVFWDIGACLGIHSFVLSSHIPFGRVHSFEPMPTNRAILTDNMHINSEVDSVVIHKEAVSDSKGVRSFDIRESEMPGFGRHSFSKGDYDSIRSMDVDTICGDYLVFEEDFEVPNIVKIDVEGATPLVLEGMSNVLEDDSCRDVFIETHEPNSTQPSYKDFGYDRNDIINFMTDRGFSVKEVCNEFHLHFTKNSHYDIDKNKKKEYVKDNTSIVVKKGDISEESTDAIVNSAGTSLFMGSGVAGSLKRKGGEKLNREAVQSGPVELGSAIVTDSYDLNSEIVIHAASMPHFGNGKSTLESIRMSIEESLDKAESYNCESISIPAVGCGIAGISIAKGIREIIKVVDNYEFDNIRQVNLILYTEDDYNLSKEIANIVLS